MAAVNGSSHANDEWQTAGKPKPQRSAKSASQMAKPQNGESLANGHANGVPPPNGNENGGYYENGNSYRNTSGRRGGRQNGYHGRPNTNSGSGRVQSSKPVSTKEDLSDKRKLIEKEVKNLAKHDAASERIERLFNEEIEKSHDRLRRSFEEMRHLLNEREKLIAEELERCKLEGVQLLAEGQERAKQLRMETERAPSMNDRQVNDLRDQIRRFLSERRNEEELGRTIRFQFEPDRLYEMVKNFGEVIPIGKHPQKHQSQTSLVSSLDDDVSSSGTLNAKPVSEISSGGICMKSDSMTAEQLAMLTQHLKESLKLQGIAEDILPDVSGVAGNMPAPRRRPPPARGDHNGHNGNQYQNGRGGGKGGQGGGGRKY